MRLRVADFHYPPGSKTLRCRSCNAKLGEEHAAICFFSPVAIDEPAPPRNPPSEDER